MPMTPPVPENEPRPGRRKDFDPALLMETALPVWPQVTLVPWGTNTPKPSQRAAGLFAADGTPIDSARCQRGWREFVTVTPEHDGQAPSEHLAGQWLFGGILYGHFGHLLCESTSRLWALDHLGDFRGIIFHPKVRLARERVLIRESRALFHALGLKGLEIRAPQKPVTIAGVVIPEQGFGTGQMAAGRPQYRDFMRNRLSAAAAPQGPHRLYVSRSRLISKRGSVVVEKRIEALMEAAGYTVFHPQEHPLTVQVAHYRAARSIVALDGSALHLAALVLHSDAQVAILNRGPSKNIGDYVRQFRAFASVDPLQVDAVSAWWFETGRSIVRREVHALLHLPDVGAALAAAGFLPAGTRWEAAPPDEVAAAVADLETRLGKPLTRYTPGSPPA